MRTGPAGKFYEDLRAVGTQGKFVTIGTQGKFVTVEDATT